MQIEITSSGSAAGQDALGALKFDVENRRAPPVANRRTLAAGAALAVALHLAVVLVLTVMQLPGGFLQSTSEPDAIGVEIVVASALAGDEALAKRGGEAEAPATPAAKAAQDVAPDQKPDPQPPAPEIADKSAAPPDQTAPAAEKLAEREVAKELKDDPEKPNLEAKQSLQPSAPAAPTEAVERGSEDAPKADEKAAPPLAMEQGSGLEASGYERLVVETLRRRPPRAPSNRRGTVSIAFSIAINGTVATARIKSSSGSPDIDNAALETVRTTRFAPPPSVEQARREFEIPYTFR